MLSFIQSLVLQVSLTRLNQTPITNAYCHQQFICFFAFSPPPPKSTFLLMQHKYNKRIESVWGPHILSRSVSRKVDPIDAIWFLSHFFFWWGKMSCVSLGWRRLHCGMFIFPAVWICGHCLPNVCCLFHNFIFFIYLVIWLFTLGYS